MAKLDITERRLPQDGRSSTSCRRPQDRHSCSTFPTSRGEKVPSASSTSRASCRPRALGFSDRIRDRLRSRQPTGSSSSPGRPDRQIDDALRRAERDQLAGKQHLHRRGPVEYPLVGSARCRERVGLTFPKALRTILRLDPDIIMVGEVRDEETAGDPGGADGTSRPQHLTHQRCLLGRLRGWSIWASSRS